MLNNKFLKISDGFDEQITTKIYESIVSEYHSVKNIGDIGGSMPGHLNCELSSSLDNEILNYLSQNEFYKNIEETFAVNIKDYAPVIGANINLPGSAHQHIHQDGNFHEESFIVNVALQDINLENGAIEIILSTGHKPISYYHFLKEGHYKNKTRVIMSAGDCLLRSSNIWHRGMPNFSKKPRLMLNIVFHKLNSKIGKCLLNNGDVKSKVSITPNWYGSSASERLKERIFTKLPWILAIKRIFFSFIRPLGDYT